MQQRQEQHSFRETMIFFFEWSECLSIYNALREGNRSMQFTGENKISKKLNYSCVVVLLLTLSAYAQLQPPAGWTSVNGGNAVVMTSPSDASGHIALTLLPPTSLIGEIKSWFAKQTLALAQVAGRPTGSTNVMDQNGVLFRGIEIENQNNAN